MREINGKIGARDDGERTIEVFIVAHLPLRAVTSKRRERKDACWALPPKHLPSPGRYSCSNNPRHRNFDFLKLYASLERGPTLSASVSPSHVQNNIGILSTNPYTHLQGPSPSSALHHNTRPGLADIPRLRRSPTAQPCAQTCAQSPEPYHQ